MKTTTRKASKMPNVQRPFPNVYLLGRTYPRSARLYCANISQPEGEQRDATMS